MSDLQLQVLGIGKLGDDTDVWLMMREQNFQRVLLGMMIDQCCRMQLVPERRGWVSSTVCSARSDRKLDAARCGLLLVSALNSFVTLYLPNDFKV